MPSDPTRPGGPRYTRAQRRLLTGLAGLVVAALAAGAYVLTYDALRELALAGRASRRWAPLYPAMADTLTAMTILSLIVTRNARWWTRLLRWTLLLLLIAGGAAVSGQHSVWGYASLPDDVVRAGVAVAPHVMLVTAVWLWLTMFKQIRVARPSAEEAAPVDTQRGHVKVLEPAAPPLALEAPAEPDPEPLIPFEPEADEAPEHLIPFPREEPDPAPSPEQAPDTPQEPAAHEPIAHEPAAHEPAAREPAGWEGALFHVGEDEDDSWAFDEAGYGGSLSSEPAPPLDALPEPRPPVEPVPVLLPTDVELVRSRERDGAEPRPVAATTRPDIALPGADEDLYDAPPADRAEDPDAGDPDAGDPEAGDPEAGDPDKDRNPPPSSSFRSGPTPPAD